MPDDLPEPSDADLAAVRRLLRAARVDEPMPDHVVARLDDTLTGLIAERSTPAPLTEADEGATAASGDELAARRARRRRLVGGAGLVAAAAVVAAGFLGQIVAEDAPDSSTAGGESSSQMTDEAPADEAQPVQPDRTGAPRDLRRESEAPGAVPSRMPLSADEHRAASYALGVLTDSEMNGYRAELDNSLRHDLALAARKQCGEWSSKATLVDLDLDLDGEVADLVLALEPLRSDGTRSVHVVDCQAAPPVALQTVEVPALD